jgi:Dihydropteroate synthase (EC 2.5.1.15)
VFEFSKKTYIMGILNITPDSFSDGGSYGSVQEAVERAKVMIGEGADIIDVGGESTRPGYTLLSDQEEIDRISPVIRELVKEINVPISVDTYKANVAREALRLGAHIINDIWGLQREPELPRQ